MRVPLGVVGIVYESRPNVTADAAALCLKSGNACILRGGSEAIHSNQAIAKCVREGLVSAGLPEDAVQLIATIDRAVVGLLATMDEFVDVLIPRGGKGLIQRVADEATVPVLKHLDGICHVFIDEHADADMAIRIADNAKTQRYSPCNTMETLLVHGRIASRVLPPLAAIYAAKGVELRGDAGARAIVPAMGPRDGGDWRTEYLAPILSVRVVASLDAAIDHIARYGSQHTDAHRHRALRQRDALSARSRLELGHGERVDAIRRRLRIWTRSGDRDLDQQAPRARPGRARGTHQPQVGRAGKRADPNVTCP